MSSKDLGDLGIAAGDIIDRAFTLGYETGRNYIPDGGMALTAEQVEDVRLLAASVVKTNRGAAFEARDRLRALFPATEPAEERCRKWTVRVAGGIETGVQCVLPDGHECFHDYVPPIHNYVRPAPAEPAEEETKAERCPSEIEGWGCSLTNGHDGDHTAHDQDGPAYVWPASSPVVPAPTETGPHIGGAWLTDGETKDAEMILRMVSINRHFSEWARNRCREISTTLAPFVAAEEG